MNEETWIPWATQLTTGIAVLDADLCVSWHNPVLAEWLACGMRTAQSQSVALWLPDAVLPALRRSRAENLVLRLREVALAAFDERMFLADLTAQPFADGALLLEVHALAPRRAEDSPLSATLRGFAHEVKNPLAGLRGAAQLLERRAGDAEGVQLARLIVTEADRLAALAARLLHHDAAAAPALLNIHRLLQHAGELLRAEPGAPSLVQDFDPSLPELWGDADRLQQLLLNLTRNAVEAGAHTVTLRTRAEHGVQLVGRRLRTALRVDVIDDGRGVAPELREAVFEPLVSGRPDGTGLGLALAREIARQHGGDLSCASRPGHTAFSLHLPLEVRHAR